MNNINTILKVNGLNCLFFGALFVFIPQQVLTFLSLLKPAPEIAIVTLGVVLNLYGLLLLWIGNRLKPNLKLVLIVALGDGFWVILTIGLIINQTWITSINGITVAGLVAILVGWLGWLQWQYYRSTVN